jgi:hypothetical protein
MVFKGLFHGTLILNNFTIPTQDPPEVVSPSYLMYYDGLIWEKNDPEEV